ncbi:hypothetical protein ACQEVG_35205 [Streptomyces sp. CA-135486]|uniref:hypothetical protein n=1 Tax=Streptomyces sp. CA-135486 TaxID=3240049 RepID=UPI003D8DBA76
MVASDAYEADPGRIQAAIGEIEAIAHQALAMVGEFTTAIAAYNGWEGVDDEYAIEVGAKFDKSVLGVTETGGAIAKAVESIVNGRLLELKEISGAQGFAQENIDAALAATKGIGADGGGGGKR